MQRLLSYKLCILQTSIMQHVSPDVSEWPCIWRALYTRENVIGNTRPMIHAFRLRGCATFEYDHSEEQQQRFTAAKIFYRRFRQSVVYHDDLGIVHRSTLDSWGAAAGGGGTTLDVWVPYTACVCSRWFQAHIRIYHLKY